jgi:hypothetical protein
MTTRVGRASAAARTFNLRVIRVQHRTGVNFNRPTSARYFEIPEGVTLLARDITSTIGQPLQTVAGGDYIHSTGSQCCDDR